MSNRCERSDIELKILSASRDTNDACCLLSIVYHGISPNLFGGNVGYEDPRIAELRARITELENENHTLSTLASWPARRRS